MPSDGKWSPRGWKCCTHASLGNQLAAATTCNQLPNAKNRQIKIKCNHQGAACMWEKAPYTLKLSGATFFSWFKVLKMKKQSPQKTNNKKTPLRSPSTIPTGPTHTTPACSQWCRTNLTEWEQGFVCLKPLTYFYSHCRSQSLYCVIAELTLRVYSKTERNR